MIRVFFAAYNVFKLLVRYNLRYDTESFDSWIQTVSKLKKYNKKDTIILLRCFVQLWYINKETLILILIRLLICDVWVALSYNRS